MPISAIVQGQAATRGYVTRARIKQELGDRVQNDSGADPVLDALILAASRAIDAHCSRVFVRQSLTEAVDADGSVWLMLNQNPVIQVTEVLYDNSPIIDYTLDDPDAGILFRRQGWTRTEGVGWFSASEPRPPGSIERRYQVTYVAGYLVPSDDMATRTVSCSAAQQAYLDSANGVPLLVPGDQVLASGFTTAANNGWKTVVSRTAGVLVVTGNAPLVDEAAHTASAMICEFRVRTLPEDIQQACAETVKAWYLARNRDADITSKRVGDLAVTYGRGTPTGVPGIWTTEAIPFRALGLLTPYERII